ncbi:MFS transporter [Neptunicoccus cionae]|uniref:MFS transporter n=1 Tax=Neptunicoccus cionae TaxID=2035344 RepID=UPI000C75C5DF|nr:MFS transporter [Amylibacter cionae]PLS22082.1 MFS transporter [Amylibacter cionae]
MNKEFMTHVSALALTKAADGLINPKLVLAWLLNALGAPGYLIGFLVPVRESGSLFPQLLFARMLERRSQRKYFWAGGAAVQGIAAFGMAAAAAFLDGAAAGWTILLCLAVLAVARSVCSASFKDILARTVEKGRRGRVSGLAGTLSAVVVLLFALLLSFNILPRDPVVIAIAIALAGILWLLASFIFTTLDEPEAETSDDAEQSLKGLSKPLREDGEFRTYIATRALLISTALAPPFLIMLGGGESENGFGNLGLLILASSIASIVSSYLWSTFADYSSRKTLMVAGGVSAVIFALAAVGGAFGAGGGWLIAVYVFFAQIAYQGARAGRKTHLTDMDSHDRKPVYTALSNTMIGMLLLAGGIFGVIADAAGPQLVLGIMAVLSGTAVLVGSRLSEVQQEE